MHLLAANPVEVDPGHTEGPGVLAVVEFSIFSVKSHGLSIIHTVLILDKLFNR